MYNQQYIGRFAPSPTGLLHFGSLIAAMASYCEAMVNNGQWLVRIEDIDPPREISGASKAIIKNLQDLGFLFDNNVLFQSHIDNQKDYQKALEQLIKHSYTYPCDCSRKTLQSMKLDQHDCRENKLTLKQEFSIKFKVPNRDLSFEDGVQGNYTKNLLNDLGDFILLRRDKLFSYQLAVVVDDHKQNVNHIVRGIDLIDSTPWQILLNSALNYQQPHYSHLPILINNKGQKLSKQTFAKSIQAEDSLSVLMQAFNYLKQSSFKAKPQSIHAFWDEAIKRWDIKKIRNIQSISV